MKCRIESAYTSEILRSMNYMDEYNKFFNKTKTNNSMAKGSVSNGIY